MLKKIIFYAVAVLFLGLPVHAGEGELGKDDFVTSTISDVFNKVGEYTSGEKTLLDPVDDKSSKRSGADKDALGRDIEDPAIKPLRRPSAAE